MRQTQLALGAATKESRELKKQVHDNAIKQAKSSRGKSGSGSEESALAKEIRHLAHLFEFQEDPFLWKEKFANMEKPSFKPDDPVQFEPENVEKQLAAALFEFLPSKWHTDLKEGGEFISKVSH